MGFTPTIDPVGAGSVEVTSLSEGSSIVKTYYKFTASPNDGYYAYNITYEEEYKKTGETTSGAKAFPTGSNIYPKGDITDSEIYDEDWSKVPGYEDVVFVIKNVTVHFKKNTPTTNNVYLYPATGWKVKLNDSEWKSSGAIHEEIESYGHANCTAEKDDTSETHPEAKFVKWKVVEVDGETSYHTVNPYQHTITKDTNIYLVVKILDGTNKILRDSEHNVILRKQVDNKILRDMLWRESSAG